MNEDFRDMLSALSEAGAEYLVVGAYALAAHGRPRATGDLDLWIRPTPENAERVWRALAAFGAPLQDVTQEDLSQPDLVLQIGVAPRRIDLLTSVTGVEFEEAWERRIVAQIPSMSVPVIGREDLIRNKRALDRPRDRADLALLEAEDDG